MEEVSGTLRYTSLRFIHLCKPIRIDVFRSSRQVCSRRPVLIKNKNRIDKSISAKSNRVVWFRGCTTTSPVTTRRVEVCSVRGQERDFQRQRLQSKARCHHEPSVIVRSPLYHVAAKRHTVRTYGPGWPKSYFRFLGRFIFSGGYTTALWTHVWKNHGPSLGLVTCSANTRRSRCDAGAGREDGEKSLEVIKIGVAIKTYCVRRWECDT